MHLHGEYPRSPAIYTGKGDFFHGDRGAPAGKRRPASENACFRFQLTDIFYGYIIIISYGPAGQKSRATHRTVPCVMRERMLVEGVVQGGDN